MKFSILAFSAIMAGVFAAPTGDLVQRQLGDTANGMCSAGEPSGYHRLTIIRFCPVHTRYPHNQMVSLLTYIRGGCKKVIMVYARASTETGNIVCIIIPPILLQASNYLIIFRVSPSGHFSTRAFPFGIPGISPCRELTIRVRFPSLHHHP